MPVQFTIDRSARLVVYVVQGNATREEAIEFLDAVISHPHFERGFNFLGDRRDVEQAPSSSYIYGVTEDVKLRRESLSPCKWAVIVSSDHAYGMARMWGILTEKSNVEILPFHSAGEATHWLGVPATMAPLQMIPAEVA